MTFDRGQRAGGGLVEVEKAAVYHVLIPNYRKDQPSQKSVMITMSSIYFILNMRLHTPVYSKHLSHAWQTGEGGIRINVQISRSNVATPDSKSQKRRKKHAQIVTISHSLE